MQAKPMNLRDPAGEHWANLLLLHKAPRWLMLPPENQMDFLRRCWKRGVDTA